jgi:antitoxin MazE
LTFVSNSYAFNMTHIQNRRAIMQVAKWGNSLAVRLPAIVVEALGLKEGDEIEIHVAGERQFGIARKARRAELLKRLRAFRGRLPADFKFNRDEPNPR